jgi:serine/threonine protein kinase
VAMPRRQPPSGGLSSSSDSEEEELEELPSVPRPLQPEFSGSRVSLTDIPTEDEALGTPEAGAATPMDWQEQERTPSKDQEAPSPEALPSPGQESPDGPSPRRPELRRGSSAESALPRVGSREPGRSLHKAASVELPQRRSPSPGATRLTRGGLGEGEYAQRLQALRQRLLRGGPEDGKVSGLRGPLLESLGGRARDPRMARAASSEAAPHHQPPPESRGLQKSSSFSQGEAEPRGRHRRAGAPLEIPVARLGARRLQESPSLSALSETQPPSPARPSVPKLSITKSPEPSAVTSRDSPQPPEPQPVPEKVPEPKPEPVRAAKPAQPPLALQMPTQPLTPYAQIMQSLQLSSPTLSPQDPAVPPSEPKPHAAVFARVASPPPGVSEKRVPSARTPPVLAEKARVPTVPPRPGSSLSGSIENLESEAVFEAKFKRSRESPLSRGLRLLSRSRSEERGPFRGAEDDGIYRPSPAGTPLELVRRPERSRSVQDLRVAGEPGLVRRLSLSLSQKLRRTPPGQRHPAWESRSGDGESSEGGSSARASPVLAVRRRLSSTLERLSSRLQRSGSSEDSGGASGRSTPLFGRLRRATSEGESLRRLGVPHNQLGSQTGATTPSAESLGSEASGTSGSSGKEGLGE